MKKVDLRSVYEKINYEPNEWERFLDAGCYAYILNLKVNEYFLIGDFIGRRCTDEASDEELIITFKEELYYIFNFDVQEVCTEYELKEGERKIYLQREDHTGYYHLLRQDSDGMWSHKYPKELPIREDSIGKSIENPEMMVDTPFSGWCFLLRKRAC